MSWRTRQVLRALRWLVVCAVLFVPLRAPLVEPLVDATVLVAQAESESERPNEEAVAPVGSTPRRSALPAWVARTVPPEAPARTARLYLLHAALLL